MLAAQSSRTSNSTEVSTPTPPRYSVKGLGKSMLKILKLQFNTKESTSPLCTSILATQLGMKWGCDEEGVLTLF